MSLRSSSVFVLALSFTPLFAATFQEQVAAITKRPEFKHATFGIEIYSLDKQEPLFTLNEKELFTPGSTTKLLTEGTALELLGADYRFHTPIYRTGPIGADGTLAGDVVLVASGDPNLSNRIQKDSSLAFENEDHSYGMPASAAVPGDPFAVMHELAEQIAAKGIKKITGRVLVDNSLFPEGDRELGTGVTISPVSLNDNLIDLNVTPGAAASTPASVTASPNTSYITLINHVTTTSPGTPYRIDDISDTATGDGTWMVTITGSVPATAKPRLVSYAVRSPQQFAEYALTTCLREKGIEVSSVPASENTEFARYSAFYKPENLVAEHVSPAFSEETKVTLKVSQNLHASMTPYILGAIVGKAKTKIDQAGFDQERAFLEKGDLDLSGASQADGAGGAGSAYFTPDFMVHYLAYMAKQKDFELFHKALPILGRDGTLADLEKNSPAAGHVFAKTGTFGTVDMLNRRLMLNGKGLAGYTTTPSGEHLAFALYVNEVGLPLDDPEAAQNVAGGALAQIAAAAYTTSIQKGGK